MAKYWKSSKIPNKIFLSARIKYIPEFFFQTNQITNISAERIFGLLILIALTIINAPAFFTRGRIHALPVEIEVLLLCNGTFRTCWWRCIGFVCKTSTIMTTSCCHFTLH